MEMLIINLVWFGNIFDNIGSIVWENIAHTPSYIYIYIYLPIMVHFVISNQWLWTCQIVWNVNCLSSCNSLFHFYQTANSLSVPLLMRDDADDNYDDAHHHKFLFSFVLIPLLVITINTSWCMHFAIICAVHKLQKEKFIRMSFYNCNT